MLQDFQNYIKTWKLFPENGNVLLGVSGGIDSMVMADLFSRSENKFGIAHCNFRLRGQESDEDERMVRKYASQNKILYFSVQFETKKHAETTGSSIQMAARELRMNWLSDVCNQNGFHCIATAHHLDDQIETFFINLMRSSGIAGFHGILPKSGNIVHPLMFCNKNDIIKYAEKHNIIFREDRTNAKTDYLRNKIRNKIIPELTRIHPQFSEILSKNIQKIRAVEKIYRQHLAEVWDVISEKVNKRLEIDIEKLKSLPEKETYLFEFLNPFGFNSSDAEQIAKSIYSVPGKVFMSDSYRLIIDRNFILIEDFDKSHSPKKKYPLDRTVSRISEPVIFHLKQIKKTPDFKINPDSNIAQVDADKLQFPLMIRKWEHGDSFYPLGMKGRKLISDYFTDCKASLIDKENTWILFSGNEVVWIIGQRMDERYRISSPTQHILEIHFTPTA